MTLSTAQETEGLELSWDSTTDDSWKAVMVCHSPRALPCSASRTPQCPLRALPFREHWICLQLVLLVLATQAASRSSLE